MALRVVCPFCKSNCQVEEKFLGFPVQCHLCRQPFIAKAPEPKPEPKPEPPKKIAPPAPPPTPAAVPVPVAVAAKPVAAPVPPTAPVAAVPIPVPTPPPPIAPAPLVSPTGQPAPPIPAPASAPQGSPWLDVAVATTVGRVRERNEDSCLMIRQSWNTMGQQRDMALLVVADGMGGYEAGDQASRLAIRKLGGILSALLEAGLNGTLPEPGAGLSTSLDLALRETNKAVVHEARTNPSCKGMGATVVVTLVVDSQVFISHLGDCRAYHHRGDKLTQVTRDQTLVARMVELGQLSAQEAENHHLRNEVTQALGKRGDVEPSTHQLTLERQDWLVLCCDGLPTHVNDAALKDQIRQATSPRQLAHQLVDLANAGGGTDNCTVVVARLV